MACVTLWKKRTNAFGQNKTRYKFIACAVQKTLSPSLSFGLSWRYFVHCPCFIFVHFVIAKWTTTVPFECVDKTEKRPRWWVVYLVFLLYICLFVYAHNFKLIIELASPWIVCVQFKALLSIRWAVLHCNCERPHHKCGFLIDSDARHTRIEMEYLCE